jgi:hypothetical protein
MLLIVTPNFRGEVPILARAAEILGWEVFRSPGGWRLPAELQGKAGAVYGELFFCEAIAQQMGWTLKSNSLDWLAKLPKDYLKRDVYFTTLAEARKITEKKFIKPADDKVFPAQVYDDGSALPHQDFLDGVPVLVSDKVKFSSEYRCFVKNRKVVSVSCYLMMKAINEPSNWYVSTEPIVDFVNKMLEDSSIECAPGACIDVGKFKNGDIAIIEANPAYASGIYGCEIVASLDAIKASCEMEIEK